MGNFCRNHNQSFIRVALWVKDKDKKLNINKLYLFEKDNISYVELLF